MQLCIHASHICQGIAQGYIQDNAQVDISLSKAANSLTKWALRIDTHYKASFTFLMCNITTESHEKEWLAARIRQWWSILRMHLLNIQTSAFAYHTQVIALTNSVEVILYLQIIKEHKYYI